MNYYDLSNPSTPPTRGYRLGLWRLRRQRIYRILIALAAILTYILLYLTLKRDDYTNDMLKAIVLLFCSVAVFLALLLVARNRIDVVRMRKREVQERHDYNYAMYRTLYKKNEKLRSITLLQMARQQIELHRPQMALQALELVKRERLNVAQLRSFYFYQAAAAYLDAQESWKEALSSCYAIPQKPQQLSQEEIESLFFVADWHAAHAEELEADAAKEETENSEAAELPAGSKVAVVGAGPAGLACAGDLAAKGYDVTVFESLHKPGGVLAYGIPEFRLPKSIVAAEVEKLEKRGVTFVTNAIIGKAETVDDLMDDGYKAVFVGTGAGLPSFMNIPGENLLGVCSANEYLTRINLMKGYLPEYDTPVQKAKNIAVVGGGNVAMDAARCAKRMGAENVYIVYRRSMEEIPARSEEIHHAIEEGIDFQLLRNPVKVIGDENGYVTGLECVKMELGEPDASGRRRPVAIEGSNFVLDVDCVIMAIGTKLNQLIVETTDKLEPNERGGIGTDEGAATSREGVFAGGDAVTGAATVILAMGAGKTAAASIDQYLSEK